LVEVEADGTNQQTHANKPHINTTAEAGSIGLRNIEKKRTAKKVECKMMYFVTLLFHIELKIFIN